MMMSDFECGDSDPTKQAISVADCALDLQNGLRCFGKIPRTDVDLEFAIALYTGAVAIGIMPGNASSYVSVIGLRLATYYWITLTCIR